VGSGSYLARESDAPAVVQRQGLLLIRRAYSPISAPGRNSSSTRPILTCGSRRGAATRPMFIVDLALHNSRARHSLGPGTIPIPQHRPELAEHQVVEL